MRVYYDLHLHSCLSPCGSEDMTPNNLVNMAALLGYDAIALTDHNTCRNVPAAMAAGRACGLTVIPGMELCTAEEAHVICLFPTANNALSFEELVKENSSFFENDSKIFGRQLIMNENDELVGEEPRFLLGATEISVDDVLKKARQFGGTAFPAHVDRDSFSVLATLGAIPLEAGFAAAEISSKGDEEALLQSNPELRPLVRLLSSDAHYLENMPERRAWLELPDRSPQALIQVLDGRVKAKWSR